MPIQAITTKIISTLGNKESLIPIMIKDGVDSASLTYKSFKNGGKIEGTDRAIDEFGTQAIWIGGIPFFKFLADKTIYKKAKINPAVDPRIISNNDYAEWALKNAKGFMPNNKNESVYTALHNCLKDGGKLTKNLYTTKVAAATLLTLGTFFLMTKFKQKNTKNKVLKEMTNLDNSSEKNNIKTTLKNNNLFAEFTNKYNFNPSFKGIIKNITEKIMFNPVHNMKIIDAGITTERLACSRNKNEFAEHAIKEGGFLFFIYGFGNLIEKGINYFSSKIIKKPIELPIDVLADKELENALKYNKIRADFNKLPKENNNLTNKLDFIIRNPNNTIVKEAKKAKIISLTKDINGKNTVDTSKYIDIKAFEKFAKNLKELDITYKASGESAKKYLNKTKALKVFSVMANIGISCLFLGYLIPKLMYKYRKDNTGTTKFHVAEDIKKTNKRPE